MKIRNVGKKKSMIWVQWQWLGAITVVLLLLAISEYDKNNIAHTSVEDLELCIKSLVNFYDQHGQGHRLVIPLMGTNLSRAGLSHDDSLRVITSLFQLYGDKIHGEIDVVIYKGDKDKVTLDI